MELIPVGLLGSIIVGANFVLNKQQKAVVSALATSAGTKVQNAIETVTNAKNNLQNALEGKIRPPENVEIENTDKYAHHKFITPEISVEKGSRIRRLPKKKVDDEKPLEPTVNLYNLKSLSNNNGEESIPEKLSRRILETIYNKPFPKDSNFIKNPATNRFLELDGYCPEYKIAFEYQGEHHYIFPHKFWKNRKTGKCGKKERINFLKSIKKDKYKVTKCKTLNIALIIIPYTEKDSLDSYLCKVSPRVVDGKREPLPLWEKRLERIRAEINN